MLRLPISCLLFFTSLPCAWGQFEAPGADAATTATLVSEAKSIAPGATFSVALKLDHPAGWHSYYQNSGGVELPPAFKWSLPDGFAAGPIQWPVPEVKDGFFGKSFVYSGSPVLVVDLTAPANVQAGKTVTLTLDASWQICEETCLNEQKSFTLTLPVGTALEKDAATADLFANARARQAAKPGPWQITAHEDGQHIVLRIEPDTALAGDPTDFIPNQAFVQPASAGGSIRRDGKAWVLQLKRATKDGLENPIPQGQSFSGILAGPHPIAVPETPIGSAATTTGGASTGATYATPPPAPSFTKYFLIFGGMFLGGLILNLMPCVFPVIGIKIMGFVQQAGHNQKKIMLHGLLYTAGVLVSFWVLSLALFLGGITSWGNQLQDPRVTIVTILIMMLLGMNLFGVFEIGTSAASVGGNLIHKQGIAGTFFSGVLATLIATPCSGPFLGTAIGAAVSLPTVPFFAAFTMMALGLALPYLVLSCYPAWVEKLPRPGPWMESFKQGMSFLLFATAGIFLWVYSAQVFDRNEGQKGLWVMVGLCAVATSAWIYGRWNQPVRRNSVRRVAKGLAAAICAGGILAAWPWSAPAAVAANDKPSIQWGVWSPAEVDRQLAAGHPVFVDFTAKWCLTCQVNKSRAYTQPVMELMKNKGIVTLRADKTNPDPMIETKLKEMGRSAIPVNVLLVPGKDPLITPALLSPDYLLDLFRSEVPDPKLPAKL